MNLLLDTCALIWSLCEPKSLSPHARQALKDPTHSIHVSTVTFWEIALKSSIGKLEMEGVRPEDFPALVKEEEWSILPLDAETASGFGRIPKVDGHKDPFDRMLIHTAIGGGYHFVSKDAFVTEYLKLGLKVCW